MTAHLPPDPREVFPSSLDVPQSAPLAYEPTPHTVPTPFEDLENRCYRHPLRETGVRCVRCDRPICPECMRPASVGFQCPDDVRAARIVTRNQMNAPVSAGRSLRPPWATGTLLAINVLVYVVTAAQSVKGINDPVASALFRRWVLVPWYAAHGGDSAGHELYRLLTSAFLHLSLTHLVLNMIALAVIGSGLERMLGWWRFASVYLLAALGGSVAVYLFDSKYTAVAGASGGIYGLFAASVLVYRKLGLDTRSLVAVIAINVLFTFTVPNISWLGHLGGFVGGGLATLAITQARGASAKARTIVQSTGLGVVFVAVCVAIALRTAAL